MKEYNYTVIIPHYNIPELLRRCLQSIPKRDDTQVIVIDDNSSDETKTKLNKFLNEFDNIELISLNENGGGGKARNAGLEKAKGKYILFADADDYFNYCIGSIFDEYISKDIDLVFFTSNSVESNTYQVSNFTKDKYSIAVRNKDEFKLRYVYGVPWGKLINRSMIVKHDIKFQETFRHNDVGFSYLIGYYAKTINYDQRALYNYTFRNDSVSRNQSYESQKAALYVFGTKYVFLKSKGIQILFPRQIVNILFGLKGHIEKYNDCLNILVDCGITEDVINTQINKEKVRRIFRKIKSLFAKLYVDDFR